MDILQNKNYEKYNYISRYSQTPYYYNTIDKRYINGIGYNMLKNVTWVTHKVSQTDNLDYLALKYYGNPTYWWIIAYFNNIQDSLIVLSENYETIKIPTLGTTEFGDER